jgi:sec-independent protein translocase protein TatC
MAQSESTMSFGDHLEELRRRLILSLVVPLPVMALLFAFASSVRAFLCEPLFHAMAANGLSAQMFVLSPVETMMADLKISLVGALVIAAPWILWQAWKFVAPGLHENEQRFVRLLLPGSGVLALAGLSLLYWVMLPLMLTVLVSFSVESATTIAASDSPTPNASTLRVVSEDPASAAAGEMWINAETHEVRVALPVDDDPKRIEVGRISISHPGTLTPSFRLSEYLDFLLLFALCLALAFQLPIVLLLLSWTGIVTPAMLRKGRRYALFGIVVLAAAVAPGDLFSLLLVSVPLYILYEFSILLIVIAPAGRVSRGVVLSSFGERFRRSSAGTDEGASSQRREGNEGDE